MVLLEVSVLDSSVVVKALLALFITIEPAVVEAVPSVRLAPATVAVPVKLAVPEMVWPLMLPEEMVPVVVMLPLPKVSEPLLVLNPPPAVAMALPLVVSPPGTDTV